MFWKSLQQHTRQPMEMYIHGCNNHKNKDKSVHNIIWDIINSSLEQHDAWRTHSNDTKPQQYTKQIFERRATTPGPGVPTANQQYMAIIQLIQAIPIVITNGYMVYDIKTMRAGQMQ